MTDNLEFSFSLASNNDIVDVFSIYCTIHPAANKSASVPPYNTGTHCPNLHQFHPITQAHIHIHVLKQSTIFNLYTFSLPTLLPSPSDTTSFLSRFLSDSFISSGVFPFFPAFFVFPLEKKPGFPFYPSTRSDPGVNVPYSSPTDYDPTTILPCLSSSFSARVCDRIVSPISCKCSFYLGTDHDWIVYFCAYSDSNNAALIFDW